VTPSLEIAVHHRFVVLACLVLALGACGQAPTQSVEEDASAEGADTPLLGEGITAVTSVYPLAAVAEDIAPGADVRLLTSSGQDPHDLELSPDDRRLVESADVVLYMGDLDFQPQVEAAVADATGAVVSVAEVAGSDNLRRLEGHDHEDGDDHGHGDGDDDHADDADDDHGSGQQEDAHAHDDEAVDPHLWFDAAIMAGVAEAVGEAFAAADPDRADGYRERAGALHDELAALDEDIDAVFADCAHDTAIVSHEAYAYLLERRGLAQEGISGAGGHADASPARLAELTERIRAEGIPAVLAEPIEGRGDAEALASEAGVDLLDVDPLEIGEAHLAGVRFPDALRAQAEAFATALECT